MVSPLTSEPQSCLLHHLLTPLKFKFSVRTISVQDSPAWMKNTKSHDLKNADHSCFTSKKTHGCKVLQIVLISSSEFFFFLKQKQKAFSLSVAIKQI